MIKNKWKEKLNNDDINLLINNLTSCFNEIKNKVDEKFLPFWNYEKNIISSKLWLPDNLNNDNILLTSKLSDNYNINKYGRSWFSINEKNQDNNTFNFNSTDYIFPSETENIKPEYKTVKIRLFPSKEEKDKLKICFAQYRWYYNFTLDVIKKESVKTNFKLDWKKIRQICRKYKLEQYIHGNLNFLDFVYDENKNSEFHKPPFWIDEDTFDDKQNIKNSTLITGAIQKCIQSLNSAISNKKNGNIKNFNMKYIMKKKNNNELIHFEDKNFMSWIRKIKSTYSYTDKNKKRHNLSTNDIHNLFLRGCEVVHERNTDKYYIYYPVDIDWFPKEDKRIENQDKFNFNGERIISLDPGVRKFLLGYDPTGKVVFIGDKARKKLARKLKYLDTQENKTILWKKIKNYVNDLHWKTIVYLIENYDIIILPEFETSKMIKSKNIDKMTKRLLSVFSFYVFKERLKYKCSLYNKKLIIVNEAYTSKTCGNCGVLNDVKCSEIYDCKVCKKVFDRDVNGARNILIKNLCSRNT
jgi:IS605 OrfB family transposase